MSLTDVGGYIVFVSLSVNLIGIVIGGLHVNLSLKKWFLGYVCTLFVIESIGLYLNLYDKKGVLFLIGFSFYLHFAYLTYFYSKLVFKLENIYHYALQLIGLLGFAWMMQPDIASTKIAYYARIPYSLAITGYSLVCFYYLIKESNQTRNMPLWVLNSAILVFFALDAFLATGTEYLMNREYLHLVAWFWFFRAIFLQLFYLALIYYGWKSHRPTERSL
jgi:hypothetical protein